MCNVCGLRPGADPRVEHLKDASFGQAASLTYYTECQITECGYSEYHYIECDYAKCHYAEYHIATTILPSERGTKCSTQVGYILTR